MKRQGISLIVLVITIIVMIILAAAIIISLNNTGIIGNANKAKDETNEKTIVELANLAWGEAYANSRTIGKLASANYFQKSVEDALIQNDVDLSQYEVIAGEDGVQVFKKNDWEYAYTATNDAWNDTKLEKAKGDTIPEDAKIVVKFYKTNKIIKTNYCPLISGASDYCEEKQNLLKNNEYYMVIDGVGSVPNLCKFSLIDSSTNFPDYAYIKGLAGYMRMLWTAEDIYDEVGIEEDKEIVTNYVTHAIVKEGITNIGRATFCYLFNLQNVILPNSLTSLGDNDGVMIFWQNDIQNLLIPSNVEKIKTRFEGNGIKNLYVETTKLTEAEMGDYSSSFKGTIYVRNDAMKTLFESKIDSSKAKVSSDYNW